jgi:hypothetical protein
MMTFITDFDQKITAKNLDNKRLGKQRVEAIQIASCLLLKETKWKNHPAVKMWKGYESYLIKIYLYEILQEWSNRGFKNDKCLNHFNILFLQVLNKKVIIPTWLNQKFINSHKSNLIRKNPEYYQPIFGYSIPNNISYIWPI